MWRGSYSLARAGSTRQRESLQEKETRMWWSRDDHARRRPYLTARAATMRVIRDWFEDRDFIEVETAALQRTPCLETHLHAVAARVTSGDGQHADLWLHTSPEFACKKLLAAGEEKIFSLGKVWRDAEASRLHHPEFTLLEWYRKGGNYGDLMEDCAGLLRCAAEALDVESLRWGANSCDPYAPWERVTVVEAVRRATGIELLESLEDPARPSAEILRKGARAAGIRVADDDSWGDLFTKIMVGHVEPGLGMGRPTLLCDYPVPEAALARRKRGDPRIAERFELYCAGVELANGFGELSDPAEQRARFEADQALKSKLYGFSYPLDADLLAALPLMGEAAGIALGADRLVMLLTGAADIRDVIWSPVETGFV